MDRDAAIEAAAALLGAGTLAAIIVSIGSLYREGGSLSTEGGLALVGAIAFFVVVMSAIGLGLSRVKGSDGDR